MGCILANQGIPRACMCDQRRAVKESRAPNRAWTASILLVFRFASGQSFEELECLLDQDSLLRGSVIVSLFR